MDLKFDVAVVASGTPAAHHMFFFFFFFPHHFFLTAGQVVLHVFECVCSVTVWHVFIQLSFVKKEIV